MNALDKDFVQFCRQATDNQLVNILRTEWNAKRDYNSAKKAAKERGWVVRRGERVN